MKNGLMGEAGPEAIMPLSHSRLRTTWRTRLAWSLRRFANRLDPQRLTFTAEVAAELRTQMEHDLPAMIEKAKRRGVLKA